MNYYISDLHIGCSGRRDLADDEIIKKAWNETVTNADTVYILGDIGKEGKNKNVEYLCSIISQLKGHKVLVRGNHDKLNDIRIAQLFEEVCDYKRIVDFAAQKAYKVILSHCPIMFWPGQHSGAIHLYGHLHDTYEYDLYNKFLEQTNDYFKLTGDKAPVAINTYYRLSYMDYKPRTLEQLLRGVGK